MLKFNYLAISTHSWNHLFDNNFLSVYNVRNAVLGTEDTAEDKMSKNFCPYEACIFRREKNNKQHK